MLFQTLLYNLTMNILQQIFNDHFNTLLNSNATVRTAVFKTSTKVPVRFIAENLGATVEWDEINQTVTIK